MHILDFDVSNIKFFFLNKVEDAVIHVIIDKAYRLKSSLAFQLALSHK